MNEANTGELPPREKNFNDHLIDVLHKQVADLNGQLGTAVGVVKGLVSEFQAYALPGNREKTIQAAKDFLKEHGH